MSKDARAKCALCGQEALGFAMADGKRLCHDDKRSCYHRWTVYGERPSSLKTELAQLADD